MRKIWVSSFSNLPDIIQDQSRLAPPWERWEPDPDFLYELHKWNIAHKEDKIPAVLAKVYSVLESKPLQAALEFIPDSPFPAKLLVKAMISLFLLGSVSDVSCQLPILIFKHRKFLRRSRTSIAFRIRSLLISPTWPKYLVRPEVVSCRRKLGKICKRLGGQSLEYFVIRLRDDFRDLVNKICKWAHDGLVSFVFRQ
jgi:hypothetical protein